MCTTKKKNYVVKSTANDFVASHYKKFKLSKKRFEQTKKKYNKYSPRTNAEPHNFNTNVCVSIYNYNYLQFLKSFNSEKKQHSDVGEVIDLTECNGLQFYKHNQNIEIIRNTKIMFESSFFQMLRLRLPMYDNLYEIHSMIFKTIKTTENTDE